MQYVHTSHIFLSYTLMTLRYSTAGLALVFFLRGAQSTFAQTSNDPAGEHAWAAGAIAHAQKMRAFKDADIGSQPGRGTIPKFEEQGDPSGEIASFQPGGSTSTAFK